MSLPVASDTGCPAHPRAARYSHGRVRAADRCVRGCQPPGPGPVLPTTPPARALLRQSAILARLTIPDASFGGGPVPLRPAQRPRTTSPVAPRHAASGRYSWPALTPRSDPRAELRRRARRTCHTTSADRSGPAFTLITGSVLMLGSRKADKPAMVSVKEKPMLVVVVFNQDGEDVRTFAPDAR